MVAAFFLVLGLVLIWLVTTGRARAVGEAIMGTSGPSPATPGRTPTAT